MQQPVDINSLTLVELESLAYKETKMRDSAIRNLQILDQLIAQKQPKEESKDQID